MNASDMKERVQEWWADRYLPPKGHVVWFFIKGVFAVACVVWMASHGSVHVQDAAGLVGAGVGGWLVRSVFKGEQ